MRLTFIIVLSSLLLTANPAQAQKIIERNAPLKSGERVTLRLDHANHIRLRAGSGNQLTLKATVSINQNKLNDALQLDVSPNLAGGLTVTSTLNKQLLEKSPASSCDCPNGHFWGNTTIGKDGRSDCQGVCLAIEIDITLPANTTIDVSTISGDIEISGLTGPLKAKSISGYVEARWPAKTAAELTLASVTGEVYTDPDVMLRDVKRPEVNVGYPVHGRLGDAGGAAVHLESVSGDVFFKREK